MKDPCKRPCKACPYRRKSLAGWLGSDTPEGFAATTMADVPMPCHSTIDYEDPDWKETQLPKARHCRGALVLFANTCKISRDPERPRVEPDHEEVFSNAAEFIEHHKTPLAEIVRKRREAREDSE